MGLQHDLQTALKQLDPKNDAHWTGDGLPRLDSEVLNKAFTRNQVTREAPLFTRSNPSFAAPDPDGDDQPEPENGEEPQSLFGMEPSEFGGAAPLTEAPETSEPSVSSVEVQEALTEAKLNADDALAEAHKAADKAREAVDKATKARDLVVQAQGEAYDPHASQRAVYSYLQSVQDRLHPKDAPAPDQAKSAVDVALNRRRAGREGQRPTVPIRK